MPAIYPNSSYVLPAMMPLSPSSEFSVVLPGGIPRRACGISLFPLCTCCVQRSDPSEVLRVDDTLLDTTTVPGQYFLMISWICDSPSMVSVYQHNAVGVQLIVVHSTPSPPPPRPCTLRSEGARNSEFSIPRHTDACVTTYLGVILC